MTDPERILISGCYGFKNAGDDALLGLVLDTLRERFTRATFFVVAGDAQEIATQHKVESVHWQDIAAITDLAKRADLMVLGGGGLFQDYEPLLPQDILTSRHGGVANYSGFGFLAYLTQTPLVIWAVGVGPLTSDIGRQYVRATFQIATRASVRDDQSRKLLDEIGVDTTDIAVGADPALLLTPKGNPAELIASAGLASDSPTIMVSVRDWPGSWLEAFAAGLDRIIKERPDHQLLFVPLLSESSYYPGDAEPAAAILAALKSTPRAAIFTRRSTPNEISALISGASLIIGMRFHAILFGLTHGIPTAAVAYDPKVTALMASMGLSQRSIEAQDLRAADLFHLAMEALNQGPQQPARLKFQQQSASIHSELFINIAPRAHTELDGLIHGLIIDRVTSTATANEQIAALQTQLSELQIVKEELRQSQALASSFSARLYNIERSQWWLMGKPIRWIMSYPMMFIKHARMGFALMRREGIRAAFAAAWSRLTFRLKATMRAANHRRELARILTHHDGKPIAVFLPIVPWDIPLFQRPQHIAPGMARAGFLYFFCTSDGRRDEVNGFREIAPGCILTDQADLLLAMDNAKVVHVYSTDQKHDLAAIRSATGPKDVVLYEYIDEIHGDIHGRELNQMEIERHEALLSDPEVYCVTSADRLYQDALSRRPDNVALVTNGVDLDHFSKKRSECPLPPAMRSVVDKGNPIIGYHGALAKWFDYELIIQVAKARPDLEIVLIGVDYDGSMLAHNMEQYSNIHFLGPISYEVLPQHSVYFDVAIIPFRLYELTESTSPIKLFEYMALGTPIVTTALRECQKYDSVLISDSPSDFSDKLDEALALRADEDYLALLSAEARDNSWQTKSKVMADLMQTRLNEQLVDS